jgi:hypothetical protein
MDEWQQSRKGVEGGGGKLGGEKNDGMNYLEWKSVCEK